MCFPSITDCDQLWDLKILKILYCVWLSIFGLCISSPFQTKLKQIKLHWALKNVLHPPCIDFSNHDLLGTFFWYLAHKYQPTKNGTWGTPLAASLAFDIMPLNLTNCIMLFKYNSIKFSFLLGTRYIVNNSVESFPEIQ